MKAAVERLFSSAAPAVFYCLEQRRESAGARQALRSSILISVVESETKLKQAAEAIEAMITDGLIVFSDVDIIRLVHSNPPEESADATVSAR